MSCVQGVCKTWPGGPCGSYDDCTSQSCANGGGGVGVCACNPPSYLCRTDADCCDGYCIQGQCTLSGEGGPCKTDNDCTIGACVGGQCQCVPAGSHASTGRGHCCSGWIVLGVCTAQGGVNAGSGCTTRVPDCYGGDCVNGQCLCVGPSGYCGTAADCCAGATACIQRQGSGIGQCVVDQ
jgi:hypothetical protein